MKLYALQCEGQENPMGVDRQQPMLQWKINDARRGAAQTAYQVLVASTPELLAGDQGDLWDSGKRESSESVHVMYEGTPLSSQQTGYWKVKIWDQEGQPSGWSETATWEMGLLTPADWQASWIARSAENPVRSVYMRKEVSLEGPDIAKARLFVTGLGNYIFYINGNRVGDDLLTPGWTDFTKRVEYQVYDVADLLDSGPNALGAELGSMWWSGGLGWQGGVKYSNGPLKLLAMLQITHEDGTSECFFHRYHLEMA